MATRNKTHTVRVGLVQMPCSASPADNLKKALSMIAEAARRGAQIVCLPELFRSRYFCQNEDHANFSLAESIPGPTTTALASAARKHRIVLIGSLFEKRAAGIYHNTAVILDADGKLLGRYRKMHIPDDPRYYEKFYFTPGDLGFRTWHTRHASIGALICWDQWFPEAARLTALSGAEMLFYPTAIGWHPAEKKQCGTTQHDAWETIQRSHAIANGCFVAAVNRIGHERLSESDDGIEFWGQSFVAGPDGQILVRASTTGEEIVIADCNLDLVEQSRTHWPFLRDRRIDAYHDLTRRTVEE